MGVLWISNCTSPYGRFYGCTGSFHPASALAGPGFRSYRHHLLILSGLAVLAGTLILQRPITEPAKLHQAYSPETLRLLDTLRLTDVFHSWWFVLLLSLLSANIVVASIDRFPAAWRYFSRPLRRAEPHFFTSLAMKQSIPLRGPRWTWKEWNSPSAAPAGSQNTSATTAARFRFTPSASASRAWRRLWCMPACC